MKFPTLSLAACSVIAALGAFSISSQALASEESDKLEALQRAMNGPGIGMEGQAAEPGKKKRTRAIVFDNADSAPAQGAQPAAQLAATPKNCPSISPDSPGTAVDFAIQFDVGSANISSASAPLLDQIGKVLSLNPSSCIVVEGHTDISGNADKNTILSRQRAESVVKYLSRSIESVRLVPVGRGSTLPLKDVDPSSPKNRRVVFKVVS